MLNGIFIDGIPVFLFPWSNFATDIILIISSREI